MNYKKTSIHLVVWVSPLADERICIQAEADGFCLYREYFCGETGRWTIDDDFGFDHEQLEPLIDALTTLAIKEPNQFCGGVRQ